MPTYEYVCESCGYEFERFQNMNDARIKECPQCGQQINRLISGGIGVIMKNNNFHATEVRKNNISAGKTCCGKEERCDRPPCSSDGVCKR